MAIPISDNGNDVDPTERCGNTIEEVVTTTPYTYQVGQSWVIYSTWLGYGGEQCPTLQSEVPQINSENFKSCKTAEKENEQEELEPQVESHGPASVTSEPHLDVRNGQDNGVPLQSDKELCFECNQWAIDVKAIVDRDEDVTGKENRSGLLANNSQDIQ